MPPRPAKAPVVPEGPAVPVTIRDLALVRKLCGVQVAGARAVGSIAIRVPGAANGGQDLVVAWAIDPGAWSQQGRRRDGEPKEAA